MRFTLLTLALLALPAAAAVTTETVSYRIDGTEHVGYLAYDDAVQGSRPGILIIHEWWGLNEYIEWRTRQLAELGYVAFAADMYGGGRDTGDPIKAEAWSKEAGPHLRPRARAALQQLMEHPRVDSLRLGAIGFCFGGTSALQLAYDGAEIQGAVSFHGHLPLPAEDDEIYTSILVLHGSADPFVPPEDVAAWEKAMNERPYLDWHLVAYGVAYNEAATNRAWAHMQTFFEAIFNGGGGY
jgi:dienelactone hydrolase